MDKGRVLITGGAGFIGSHLVERVLAAGYAPFVVDDLSSGTRANLPPDTPLYEMDIRDSHRLSRVFSEVRPESVCHLAAQISVSRSVREPHLDADVNLLGWLRVLDQCAASGVRRVVFASSGGVMYGDVFEPADENSPLRPISPYGINKLTGERYLEFYTRERSLSGVALRYGNVYGPRQDPHGEAGVVAIFAQRMLNGQSVTINGDGRYVRDYVNVTDVVEANLLALGAPLQTRFTVCNVGTGQGTDVVSLEAKLRKLAQRWVESPLPPAVYGPARPGDLRSNLLGAERARTVLLWHPQVGLDDGLQRTVDWFAQRAGKSALI